MTQAAEVEFVKFPKIHRLSREIIITEKIDGTNGQIIVGEDGTVTAASRNRILTTDSDNHGFARWVEEHAEELTWLGAGRHFGEWWGNGIQRGYGIKEKRFSLFNVGRWLNDDGSSSAPACCGVVPVLWNGVFDTSSVRVVMDELEATGSIASPGFMNPEGIVIYHTASGVMFKKTFEHDAEGKAA